MIQLKKPKFWDKKEPNYLSFILLPISKIVEQAGKIFSKKRVKINGIKSICVGNLYIGGTGKTSLAIELKKFLDELNIKSCFIKKYYKNQMDEIRLLKSHGETFINNSRKKALIEAKQKGYRVAILDDGLQDKELLYDLSYLCFNKKNKIGNGLVIPAGPLRENRNNIKYYDNVFLNGNYEDSSEFENFLLEKNKKIKFFYSNYVIKNLENLKTQKSIFVFSGIGNHVTFVQMLKNNNFKIFNDTEFPDHYNYTDKDLKKIVNLAQEKNLDVFTTKKDFLRIDENKRNFIKYVDVKLEFKKNDEILNQLKKFNEIN